MASVAPTLHLYVRGGCHLCADARVLLDALLADRAVHGLATPPVEERDIDTNPDWQRAFFTTIPVVELDGSRLDLVTSAAKLRRFLADVLDGAGAVA